MNCDEIKVQKNNLNRARIKIFACLPVDKIVHHLIFNQIWHIKKGLTKILARP